uniref:Putative secreted protein n=1 Tax=Anopheles marajoara TaxID=58244 RepID=A0A2M4CF16_9DIPT
MAPTTPPLFFPSLSLSLLNALSRYIFRSFFDFSHYTPCLTTNNRNKKCFFFVKTREREKFPKNRPKRM